MTPQTLAVVYKEVASRGRIKFHDCCSRKKIVLALFRMKPAKTNILIERLANADFDKIMFYFGDRFPKVAEAINAKMTL